MADAVAKPRRRWPARFGIEEDEDGMHQSLPMGDFALASRGRGQQESRNGSSSVGYDGYTLPGSTEAVSTWKAFTAGSSGCVLSSTCPSLCRPAGSEIRVQRVISERQEGDSLSTQREDLSNFQTIDVNNVMMTENLQTTSSQATWLPQNEDKQNSGWFETWNDFAQLPANGNGSQTDALTYPPLDCGKNAESLWEGEGMFLEGPFDQWLQPDDNAMWYASEAKKSSLLGDSSGSGNPICDSLLQQANGVAGACTGEEGPDKAGNKESLESADAGGEWSALLRPDRVRVNGMQQMQWQQQLLQ